MAVHSILPPALTEAVDEVLTASGVPHVAHGDADPVGAAVAAARHDGTVLRMVARDTVVAQRIAERLRGRGALVIAGDHEYGLQLDGQLRLAGLERVSETPDVIVLAGLAGEPENEAARALAPLPIVAFDGIQGESFPDQEVTIALAYAPGPVGVAEARRAAEIAVAARDLEEMRRLGPFDEHGDPVDPLVRFERYDA